MEDQGKRLLLAVAAAFAIMIVWTMLFPEKPPEKKKDDAAEKKKKDGDETSPAPDGKKSDGKTADGKKSDGKTADGKKSDGKKSDGKKSDGKTADGKTADGKKATPKVVECSAPAISRKFSKIDATFSPCGGTLTSWKLLGKKFEDRTKKDKRPLDLAPTGGNAATRSFTVAFKEGSTFTIPANARWQVKEFKDRPDKLHFTYPPDGTKSDLQVVKEYLIYPNDYLLQVVVKVRNLTTTEAKQTLVVSMFQYQDPDGDKGGGWTSVERRWKATCRINSSTKNATYGDLKEKDRFDRGTVQWAGFMHSYFLAAVSPKDRGDSELECRRTRIKRFKGVMRTDLTFETSPPLKQADEAPYQETMFAYLGPKYLDKLEAIAKITGYNTGFQNAIDLGITSFIARPLLWMLQWLQSFVINWGIAIILLTVFVKLATLYWTHKSMKSMKAMAKLKPEIEKIQKKFKDDKQRQQVEIMGMYKAHKVNPLAGCLPMILQMPIWYALYQTLMYAAELYQAPFIPGWIDDLTAPDPLYITPVLLMGMMFLQSKLTPTAADSTQQKIMMYGMPLMFGVFAFFFPAGLTIYILTNTCLTALHHLYMHKQDKDDPSAKKGGDKSGSTEKAAALDDDDDDIEPDDDGPGSKSKTPKSKKTAQQNRPRKKGNKTKKRPGQKKKGPRNRSA